jgi:hypothetical protein
MKPQDTGRRVFSSIEDVNSAQAQVAAIPRGQGGLNAKTNPIIQNLINVLAQYKSGQDALKTRQTR